MTDSVRPRGVRNPAAAVEGTRLIRYARPSGVKCYRGPRASVKVKPFSGDELEGGWRLTSDAPRDDHDPDPAAIAGVPVGLLMDRSLIPTDVVVALTVVASIPPGRWETRARNARLCGLSGFRPRCIQESLVRLADAGWFAVDYRAGKYRKHGRLITPLWLPDDRVGGEP